MSAARSQLEPGLATGVATCVPRELKDFRNYHAGETILVCGCGSSLSNVMSPERFITVGVNDVGRLFQPDYLVVLNPKQQFKGDRFRFVEQSLARAVFTQLDLGIRHPHIVKIKLGKFGGTDFSDPASLHFTRNSPYLALCLAVHMGARRIGLIGVDFTDDHFFARTGQHPLTREFSQIDQEYKRLYAACRQWGVEVFNLSACSRLSAIPKLTFEEFARPQGSGQSMRVVSYATTPVAGVPAILSRCIAACTPHYSRTVWATNSYGNGVSFEGDVEWRTAPSQARELVRSADVIIAHNGKIDPSHRPLLAGKPVITLAHNYQWNVDSSFVRDGFPGAVVGQYQATLSEFKGWQAVPNPMPLWEEAFQPGPKQLPINICYTPSGKHESYPRNHRLYWHSKGYATTMRVLEKLSRRFPIRLELIGDRQVSHAESLAMKRRAHIAIDECVTGSYHRNSLEGLACGCVVVNAVGRLPGVSDVFRYCADGAPDTPFVHAGLDQLEDVLAGLIESGHEALTAEGARNRAWIEAHWNFTRQWPRYWEPLVASARERADRESRGMKPMTHTVAVGDPSEGLSVVVCHGGRERLPQLSASLSNIRQCPGVTEIIVVDMGTCPEAEDVARRWADKYVFIRNDDVFERARCLDIGTALAKCEVVLWKDNDLIVPPTFVSSALSEMRARRLDYLIPYDSIHYLSPGDTEHVMEGTRDPADCTPVKVFRSMRHVCGAAGLVKRSFLLVNGGVSGSFRGWGGEDDAWWHKAKLLGRAAVTQRQDQRIYHLFHRNSGANDGTEHRESNPYYSSNVAVLNEMRSIRDPGLFLKRFPPQPLLSGVWDKKQIVVVSEASPATEWPVDQIAQALTGLAGLTIDLQTSADDSFRLTKPPGDGPDGVLIFGLVPALSFLSTRSLQALWPKAVVVYTGGDVTAAVSQVLRNAGAIVYLVDSSAGLRSEGLQAFHQLKAAGLRPWISERAMEVEKRPLAAAVALLQPLSVILGGASPLTVAPPATPVTRVTTNSSLGRNNVHLPVWMYWEGECPAWIERCRQTVVAHAADVRILSADDFARLRDTDADVDLAGLHVAQRADYIRAFLLMKFGGLWIDSDCIVMRPLQPVINLLDRYEFIGHRERKEGVVANDFMGAAPGSKVAAALYKRICATLRSRRPFGWTALGCVAVTEAVQSADSPWLDIKCERIQPICWSDPAPYFVVNTPAEHEGVFDSRAICYMLSNLTVQKEHGSDPSRALSADGTFFNYLIDRSLKGGGAALADGEELGSSQPTTSVFTKMTTACASGGMESVSGPGSSLEHTAEIRQRLPLAIQEIGARSLLDAPCGDFNWMKDVRLGIEEYTGIDAVPSLTERNRRLFGAPGRTFLTLDITRDDLPTADLIVCRDCLVHLSHADIFRAFRNFKASGSTYLLATTFTNAHVNKDITTGDWRPLNLQLPPFNCPAPLRIINEKCREGGGKYADKSLALWKLDEIPVGPSLSGGEAADREGTSQRTVEVFTRMLTACARARMESVSGPGSSLEHTAEIRQRLPLTIQEVGAQSLLDAPCGDFNWMKHVTLGIEEYIGIDVISGVIGKNQKQFGGPGRTFLTLDITRDDLPTADLILCRDCLVHLSHADIVRALGNFKASGSKYLLATTFTNAQVNRDITTGDWRPLNLQLPPFNCPAPLRIINEKCKEGGGKYADKSLALWKLDEILVGLEVPILSLKTGMTQR